MPGREVDGRDDVGRLGIIHGVMEPHPAPARFQAAVTLANRLPISLGGRLVDPEQVWP